MKILKLRFENLNSLYGEWIIDFSEPEYAAGGIFALTGPTGAGKSTILDAICLALYGATPRLGKITKNSNEIMSRQTGECYAEVEFLSQSGHFRCHWAQRRARKKPDGKLQDQEHQIADAATDKLIETKKSLVGSVIEAKTGMDFDRFTRSILLAQGGFDTFLKATTEQKSKILEQITGTEIYTMISLRTHERQRYEQEKLDLLLAESSGIALMTPDDEQAIIKSLSVKQKELSAHERKLKQTSAAMTWLSSIDKLKEELKDLEIHEKKAQSDSQTFEPRRKQLRQAKKAALHAGIYANICTLRTQLDADKANLRNEKKKVLELNFTIDHQKEALAEAQQKTHGLKEVLGQRAPIYKRVRALDEKISALKEATLEQKNVYDRDIVRIESDRQDLIKTQQKYQKKQADFVKANNYLKTHANDEWLVSGLTGIETQITELHLLQNELSQIAVKREQTEKGIKKIKNKFEELTAKRIKLQDKLTQAESDYKKGELALKTLLRERPLNEIKREKDSLLREISYLATINSLVAHRAELEDGKPCPLCGSNQHPFAEGNVPETEEIKQKANELHRLIEAAEKQAFSNSELKNLEIAVLKDLGEVNQQFSAVKNEHDLSAKTLQQMCENEATQQAQISKRHTRMLEKLESLNLVNVENFDNFAQSNLDAIYTCLESKLSVWQQHVETSSLIEKTLSNIKSDLKQLQAIIETKTASVYDKKLHIDKLEMQLNDVTRERHGLFSHKQPDLEESRLNQDVKKAESAEEQVRAESIRLQQALETTKSHIGELEKQAELRQAELTRTEKEFKTTLTGSGFTDEKSFIDATLPQNTLQALQGEADALDEKNTMLKTKRLDRESRLKLEINKSITEKTFEELQSEHSAMTSLIDQSRENVTRLKHQLVDNEKAKIRLAEKQSVINTQRKECQRWDKLHKLIGSSDGKKYRNFAQGLTFELMVNHANKQLEKMTDRYLLLRDDEKPLALNVVDNYQAGEIRSVKNLSGGETFIVSLTLALGLSQMASRKVRVDSLFLDEGFGTLDEDALDMALDALANLQEDGKLIGVISHVAALKERIGTQISLTPLTGGKSLLSGPGVSKLS